MVDFTFKKGLNGFKVLLMSFDKKNIFIQNDDKSFQDKINEKLKVFSFEAKEGESILIEVDKTFYVVFGVKKQYDKKDLMNLGKDILSFSKRRKIKSLDILLSKKEDVLNLIWGISLSNYSFTKYLKKDDKKEKLNTNFNFSNCNIQKDEISKIKKISENVKLTRDLVNDNANVITPSYFEKMSKDFSKKNKLKIEVLNEKDMAKKNLGLFYAVGQGDKKNPPRLIIINYNGDKKSKSYDAIVGKGVCFDTGGLNLKPTGYIEDMKTDMAGAGAVFGAFKSLVELKVKKNILCVLCCTMNSIGSNAYIPGDVFKSYGGESVEITNTDAEGRLVLADGISYIQKNYNVSKIIDLATLTGACLVALGPEISGIFSNDNDLKNGLLKASINTDEEIWELPLNEAFSLALKSKVADMVNSAGRGYGGASIAAAFIQKFVDKKTKWAHIDIAGPSRNRANQIKKYNGEFATGFGVRLLVDYFTK